MQRQLIFLLITSLVCGNSFLLAQNANDKALQNQLEKTNTLLTQSFVNKNIAGFISFCDENVIYMPEYQSTIKGAKQLNDYLKNLMEKREVTAFSKKTTEVYTSKNRAVEIGVFFISVRGVNESKIENLTGKYISVWDISNKQLKLLSEAFGYFKNVENPSVFVVKSMHYPDENNSLMDTTKSTAISFQLKAYNTLMEKAVSNRDGNLRADFFTEDAVFMPFADTLKIGMKVLRPYLIEYNSYPVTIDSISIYNVYSENLGNFIIEYPMFYVKWHNAQNNGVGSGKGIRLWRKDNDCSLKIVREIGVHDYRE